MKVLFRVSFVLFVCRILELAAGVQGVNPNTTVEQHGVDDSRSPVHVAHQQDELLTNPHESGGETVTLHLDDLPKELERRLSALRANFKQLVGHLEVTWNRDAVLQTVLATDKSLNDLKQLNPGLQQLPITIRNKVEKLEQSVENIKTTVYHLIQSLGLEHHNFTGKIGNNSISLNSLSEWVTSLSSQVIRFENSLNSSSETLAMVSEEVRFEFKQLLIFVDRIGRESIPNELLNKLLNLQLKVTTLVNNITVAIKIRRQISERIQSLRKDLDTYEKEDKLAKDLSLFRELKEKLAVIMTEVEKPNIPTYLIEDARVVKHMILLAEKHHVSVILSKIEKVLEDVGIKLSFQNNMTDIILIKENLEYVLAELHRVQTQNISMEVQIRVFLIQQMVMKYKSIVASKMCYYEHPNTAGVNVSLTDYAGRTFEDIFYLLKQQHEQLKNIFQFEKSYNVLETMKYQIEKIMIHLHYLRASVTTQFQRQLTENILKDIKYFYQLVLTTAQRTQPDIENRYFHHPNPYLGHESTNNSGQPKERISISDIIENLNTRLVNMDVQLSLPLNLPRIQEISETLFEIINELRILEERHLTADQQRDTNRIKQRAAELLAQIQIITQGKTEITETYVINGNNSHSNHHFNFEAYIKEFMNTINTMPNILRIIHYPKIYLNNTNPYSGGEDKMPRESSRPNETFQNHPDCVGRQTYDRDLLLISARVDSLQKHFTQIMEGASFSANASYFEEYSVEAKEMISELKNLHAFSALPRELKLKIEDLEQDLKNFEKHVELMIRIERGNVRTPGGIPQPSSPYKHYDEGGNSTGLIELISSFESRLESIRIRLPKETSLKHIYLMKVQVHGMLVRVKLISSNVSDSQRDRLHQLQQEMTSLVSDIELKIKTIRHLQPRVEHILPGSGSVVSTHQSMVSQLFYKIEILIQRLRRLTMQPEHGFDIDSMLQKDNKIRDQWARLTIDSALPEQSSTVENRIKNLHEALEHVNTEILEGQVSIARMREEINHLQLDFKNLKALRLPRKLQYHIDYLTAIWNFLKIRLDDASAEKVDAEIIPAQTNHHQHSYHEGHLILETLTTNLMNIQRNYFSTKDPLRLVHVLGDIYDILGKLRELQKKYPLSKLSHAVATQKKIALGFMLSVKERIWTKIMLPIRGEIEELLVRFDPKQTPLSEPRSQTLAVKQDVSALIRDMNAPDVKIAGLEIRTRLTAIVKRVLDILKKYTPEDFLKTEARLMKIVESYL